MDESDELDGKRGDSFLSDASNLPEPEPVEPIGGDSPKPEPDSPKLERTADERARDEKGRYAKQIRAGSLEQEAPAPVGQPTDAPPPAPEGEAPPVDAPPVDPNAPAPLPEPKPLTFRAWGQDITPEGVQYIEGHGAFVPEQQMAAFRQAYARAARHDHIVDRNTSLEGERRRLEHDIGGERAKFDYLANKLSIPTLIEMGVSPQMAESFIERLELDIKRMSLDHAGKFDASQSAPVSQDVSENDLADGFDQLLDRASENPEWQDMFAHPALGKELRDELRAQRKLFEVRWDALRPEEQRNLLSNGAAIPGAPVVNLRALNQRISDVVGRFRKFAVQQQGAVSRAGSVAAQVASRNATVSQPVAATRAPTVPPAATSSASASAPRSASSSRAPRSQFEGKTHEERKKAVKAWWDDPEAV